ncbi:WhiB family transcriptional regulator [Mumia sp. zg.B53]|uniref:WhiB family transcriptional regulator n=1 Tax=unclassified Mumia TaxID=2621872 RepID=UPI001C6DFB21|nr:MULTISPECIES: WhiB family transcriptional regulator [unclassified Mumia]MBW9207616.1 WhiB family transcriptional regulator [Mumia sp. zg.B17]MBW9210038.1 WhiB family transcriptional regulator [Mumia sp. zg.B21]MBW9214642.1 WhiB family transcriptional regulator [Mumia sp. zg.B53]MDD9348895.1 WhiB family transcriptional regulator [Mumia sp.]
MSAVARAALDAPDVPCRVAGADLWFAEHADEIERAKALCRACPIRDACLAAALTRREPWGVWGGEVFVKGQPVAHKRGRGRPPARCGPRAERSPRRHDIL